MNGRPWPVRSDDTLWLPAGPAVIEPAQNEPAARILDFNGELHSAKASDGSLEFSYQSSARAMAIVNVRPSKLEIDGAAVEAEFPQSGRGFLLILPRGQHVVRVETALAREAVPGLKAAAAR